MAGPIRRDRTEPPRLPLADPGFDFRVPFSAWRATNPPARDWLPERGFVSFLSRGYDRVMSEAPGQGSWTLLTTHGRALVAIAEDPGARMRDLAGVIGVTERTVQAIVGDLEDAGYLSRTRVGRRNRYTVNANRPFRHSAQDGHVVGPLLNVLADRPTQGADA